VVWYGGSGSGGERGDEKTLLNFWEIRENSTASTSCEQRGKKSRREKRIAGRRGYGSEQTMVVYQKKQSKHGAKDPVKLV